MKRIIVLSDTHIPLVVPKLPARIVKELKKADMCLHAGDYVDMKVIRDIQRYTDFHGVHGNMDDEKLRKKLPEKLLLKVESVKIGMTHGSGAPVGIRERVAAVFEKDEVDIVIFGHSHQAYMERHDGRLYFNPGSATDIFYTRVNTFGIIEIDGEKVSPAIVRI
jgi:putative phosphoesterase